MTAFWAGMQMCSFEIFLDKQIAAFPRVQEAQVEREFRARASWFELVEQFLVIDRLRPFSEGTFLVDVFNAAHQRIGGHLALVKATQWLDLAGGEGKPMVWWTFVDELKSV